MSVLETATAVQDQLLDALKSSQEAVLSAVDTMADRAAPIIEKLPSAPFADRFPKPVDVINSYYGFAQKLLVSQKDFSLKLAESYTPAKPVAKPVRKSATKAA